MQSLLKEARVMKWLTIPATALVLSGFATPLAAQGRVLTIFGEDKCPADTICVVAPESERYRIPKPFRERLPGPQSDSWAVRQQSVVNDVGKSGTGSCSASGGGGWTGCWAKYMQQQRAEAEAQKAGNATTTLP
jgi:hypothetical protein